MLNFTEGVKAREQPANDVSTRHRAITTCHLANIAIRLNRTLNWDPKKEVIAGDPRGRLAPPRKKATKLTCNRDRQHWN